MTVYGLYVFDRHCTCTFYANYNGKVPKPGPTTLPNVYRASSYSSSSKSTSTNNNNNNTGEKSILPPWEKNNTSLMTGTTTMNGDVVVGSREEAHAAAGLAFDEEAKLVFGIIFSLRNMVKKLAGRDGDSFHSYSTSAYKLHYLHTSTSTHFVLLSSPMTESLRFVLKQIHTGPYTDYVVRNPMIELDSAISGKGIDNDAFRAAVEKILITL